MSGSPPLKILLHGLNYAPEELGIGKYSGEMMQYLAEQGHQCSVVTAPPYYPEWQIRTGFSGWRYRQQAQPVAKEAAATDVETTEPVGKITVIRCPIWVPKKVTGLRRILHLASFGLSSIPAVLFQALRQRPDVVLTVEPSAFCMPTTWLAARLCGAKAWLHVQDFEVDAAFDLGILKAGWLRHLVLALERFWMRRFDRVSSISPSMLKRLADKGVAGTRTVLFPNWVNCEQMRPLDAREVQPDLSTQRLLVEQVDRDMGNVLEKVSDPDGAKHPEGRSGHRGQTPIPKTEVVRIDRQHLADHRTELRRQFGIPEDRIVAMYSGSIGAKQGLEIILQAAGNLRAESPNVHFVICGHGAAYAEIANQAAGFANIQMLPVQPLERLNALLNCADIHLLPQRADAADLVMPSKLTGMLATGRPVVASATPDTQIAVVVEQAGLVVPPGNATAFSAAILELAQSPAKRAELGVRARQYAVEHLGQTAILGHFLQQLETIVSPDVKPHRKALPAETTVPAPVSLDLPSSPKTQEPPYTVTVIDR